jgi:hypothetical protein
MHMARRGWSTRTAIVPAYDCFDTTQPTCQSGRTIFHDECVGGRAEVRDGRIFDTIANQLVKNSAASAYLMPTTIESGPTRCSTRTAENPAVFIHPAQSAPV